MAKFNGNIYRELNEQEKEESIYKVLPMLQEMMTKTDFEKMRNDYHIEEDENIPFWKFVFDNVEVKYSK